MGLRVGAAAYLDASRRKTLQRRESLLNLLETLRGECGSAVKAGVRGVGNTIRKKGDNSGRAIRERRNGNRISADLLVTIINIVEPKSDCSTYRIGCRASRRSSDGSTSRRKTGQCREGILNLIEAFRGECRSVVKAGVRGVGNTIRKKGDNSGRAIRERRNGNRASADLLVTIINIVEPKSVGQRTGLVETPAAGRPCNDGKAFLISSRHFAGNAGAPLKQVSEGLATQLGRRAIIAGGQSGRGGMVTEPRRICLLQLSILSSQKVIGQRTGLVAGPVAGAASAATATPVAGRPGNEGKAFLISSRHFAGNAGALLKQVSEGLATQFGRRAIIAGGQSGRSGMVTGSRRICLLQLSILSSQKVVGQRTGVAATRAAEATAARTVKCILVKLLSSSSF